MKKEQKCSVLIEHFNGKKNVILKITIIYSEIYKKKKILSLTEKELKIYERKQDISIDYVQNKNDCMKIGLNFNSQYLAELKAKFKFFYKTK